MPQEIIPDTGMHALAGFQIAGLLDRELGRIVVAEKFPIERRRYTGFHEVGHYFQHPDKRRLLLVPLLGNGLCRHALRDRGSGRRRRRSKGRRAPAISLVRPGAMAAAEILKLALPGYPFATDRVVLNTSPAVRAAL